MEQASAGERAASIKAHIPFLRRYARALLRDRRLADAMVGECLELALAKDDLLEPDRDLRTWLFARLHEAVHACLPRPGAGAADLSRARPQGESGLDPAAPGGREAEESRLFRLAFDRLPTEERQVLLLTGLEGLTMRQSSMVLGVAVEQVRTRICEARRRLRAIQRELGASAGPAGRGAVALCAL